MNTNRFADRTPCYRLGGLWDKAEVAEARKRVAAKLFIARYSTMNRCELRNLPTPMLVLLAQTVNELRCGRNTRS